MKNTEDTHTRVEQGSENDDMEENTDTMRNSDKLRKEEDSNDDELTATGGKGQSESNEYSTHTRAEQSNENDEMEEDTPPIGHFDEDFYQQGQE